VARNYDDLGRPSGIALDADYTLNYGYDTVGRFSAISSSVHSVSSVVQYSYLADSDLLEGWTSDTGHGFTRTFEQNRNLITGIENQHGTNLVSSFAYTNDEIGRRIARVDSSATTNTFGYSPRSEVMAAVLGLDEYEYAYDPIGNREWTRINANTNSYTANELNQYLSVTSASSAVSLSYDDDGNLLAYGDPPSHGYGGTSWEFTWDGENRLIAVASNGVTVVQNHYDYMSRRIIKATATQTNEYLYDGWNMIQETQVSGFSTQVSSFVWGLDLSQSLQGAGGVGGLLSSVKPQGSSFYFYDANGNVTELIDSNGTIIAHYEYDPYGNVSAQSGDLADEFVYRFSTKYTDDETGLVYYGFRFYNPQIGRWIGKDPLGDYGFFSEYSRQMSRRARETLWAESLRNPYAFVHNEPLTQFDPVGLVSFDETDCAEAKPTDDLSVCDVHKGVVLRKAGLQWDAECVCRCAGSSDWDKLVRGCLACAQTAGVPTTEAHEKCYAIADKKYGFLGSGLPARLDIGARCCKCIKGF